MSKILTRTLLTSLAAGAALVAMAIADGPKASADPVWVQMELCQYEDGNPDGHACLWVDPDTGDGYVVTSENYQ